MTRVIAIFFLIALSSIKGYGQFFTVKTDALGILAGNINLGAELALTPKVSLEATAYYSLFDTGIMPQVRPAIQAGFRYWVYENSTGHYLTAHYIFADHRRKTADYIHSGTSHGGGISYGYQWILSNRWNLFAEVGLGISRSREIRTDRETDSHSDIILLHRRKTVLHPSRLAVGFTYLF